MHRSIGQYLTIGDQNFEATYFDTFVIFYKNEPCVVQRRRLQTYANMNFRNKELQPHA